MWGTRGWGALARVKACVEEAHTLGSRCGPSRDWFVALVGTMVPRGVCMHRLRRVPLFCSLTLLLVAAGLNQVAPAQDAAGNNTHFAYDVVSIRQAKVISGSIGYGDLPDGFALRGLTLKPLIPDAFGVRNDAVSGWPAWANSIPFDIEAKMDPESADALRRLPKEEQDQERQRMLRVLLEDRFGLKVHRSTETRSAYALVVGRSGPKMAANMAAVDGAGKPWDADVRPTTDWTTTDGSIQGHAMPISVLVRGLEGATGAVVEDETGLQGRFNVDLHWDLQEEQGSDAAGPSLFTAVQEQLGLRLRPTKVTVSTIVIDRLEEPSPN
jgi:uncharacterized protein (TIGR03435 family)